MAALDVVLRSVVKSFRDLNLVHHCSLDGFQHAFAYDPAVAQFELLPVVFVDDFALQNNDREQARTLLTKVEIEYDKVGLKLSSSKQRLCSIISLLRKLFSKT